LPRFDHLEFEHGTEEGAAGLTRSVEAGYDEWDWLESAVEHRRRGLHENALRYYSRALELDKSLVEGWLGQVQMLILLGEYPEAELWARKSLELFRGHGDLMAGRAQALARIGDRRQAGELCDEALRREGQSAYRWVVRGELMIAGRDDIDRHCFDKAVQVDPDWLIPLEIALVYLAHDVASKALLRARQAVEKAPESFYCWYVQGRCEQRLGLDRPAGQSLMRCLELCPKHAEASRLLAELSAQRWSLGKRLRRLLGHA
jgi:tetratricopeptide (TPR) repeat protein